MPPDAPVMPRSYVTDGSCEERDGAESCACKLHRLVVAVSQQAELPEAVDRLGRRLNLSAVIGIADDLQRESTRRQMFGMQLRRRFQDHGFDCRHVVLRRVVVPRAHRLLVLQQAESGY